MKIAKTEKYLTELPAHHQDLLEGYREHLRKVADCISRNDLVIQEILKHVGNIFETGQPLPNIVSKMLTFEYLVRSLVIDLPQLLSTVFSPNFKSLYQ